MKMIIIIILLMFCCAAYAEEQEADAKITVIGKRLPTGYGLKAATLPYKVYIGGRAELEAESSLTIGDVLARSGGIVQYNSNTSLIDQSLSIGGFSDNKYVS